MDWLGSLSRARRGGLGRLGSQESGRQTEAESRSRNPQAGSRSTERATYYSGLFSRADRDGGAANYRRLDAMMAVWRESVSWGENGLDFESCSWADQAREGSHWGAGGRFHPGAGKKAPVHDTSGTPYQQPSRQTLAGKLSPATCTWFVPGCRNNIGPGHLLSQTKGWWPRFHKLAWLPCTQLAATSGWHP
jgi:hypothetical protein